MPFVQKNVTEEEGERLLLQHEELDAVYRKSRGLSIVGLSPVIWYMNEEEDASFCLLELGSEPYCGDGKTRFMLRVKENYIVLELDGYNTVVISHDSPLFEKDLYKVKYLITAAFSVAGRWGVGDTEHLNAVPDPVFKFH